MKYIFSVLGYFFIYTSSAQLPVVLHEDFNDNSHEWWIGEGENYSMKMQGGKYVISTTLKNAGRYATVAPVNNPDKDFSLEATFVQQSGSINNGFGLVWGDDGKGQHCAFVITSDGNFKIKNSEGKENLNRWLRCKVNPVGSENILKVESIGSRWYYYINGEEVAVTDPFPVYGPRLGVVNYTDMVLEVDHVIFRQDLGINLPPDLTFGAVKENLGPLVNSAYDELGPHITSDGNTLLFGVKHSPENMGGIVDEEDIWFTTNEDGKTWTKRTNLGSNINDTETNNLAAVSSDNSKLLFCYADGFRIRSRTGDGWSMPEHLEVNFKNEAPNMEGNLAPGGKAILFTSMLKDNVHYNSGRKEKDIYVSLKKKSGAWSEPINLGDQINTAGDEISPFLAADGHTLYFGSNGRPGFGSYDIYMSKRLSDDWTQWSEPVNLGPEINGRGFDAYYTMSASADYAYMVSNVNSLGKSDLVRVRLPEAIKPMPVVLITGRTFNADTRKPIGADVIFESNETAGKGGTAASDPKSGAFSQVLNHGKYGLRAVAKGYLPVIENIEVVQSNRYTEIKRDLYLVPIEEGEAIALSHVYFNQGKPTLKPTSFPELNKLAELMRENPSMKIELEGHTDNVGSKEKLMHLSSARVEEVKSYLVKKGIRKDRIEGKGYGPTQPLVANDTEENRERNRRVEFRIIKK